MKKRILPLLLAALLLSATAGTADNIARSGDVIGTVVITNGDSARVRAGDNQDTEQIGLVNPGEQYDCLGTAPSGWYKIVYPTGEIGHISNKMATLLPGMLSDSTFSYPVGTVEITHSADVRTHNGGGRDYSFMGSVHPGQSFPCVGISDTGWYAIVLDNGWIAYVFDELTTLHADQAITPNPISQAVMLTGLPALGLATITNSDTVNIRAGGSADYPVLAHGYPGSQYIYVGKAENSSWLGIALPDGQVGYVAPGLAEVTRK